MFRNEQSEIKLRFDSEIHLLLTKYQFRDVHPLSPSVCVLGVSGGKELLEVWIF